MNLIMNEGRRSENFIQSVAMKDIRDVSVFRRIRLIQLAALAENNKVKIFFTRHGKVYREKLLGKEKARRKQDCVANERRDAENNEWQFANQYKLQEEKSTRICCAQREMIVIIDHGF